MKKKIESFEERLESGSRKFAIGTLMSRFSGMARDVVTSAAFGTSAALAEFMAAYRLSFIWRRLFGEGALNVAFVPQYETVFSRSGEKAAALFFNKIHFLVAASLTLFLSLVGLITYLAPTLFPWLNPDPYFIHLNLIMLPGVLFSSLFSINAAMLQTQGEFFKAASAPIFFNSIWMLTAIIFYNAPATEAMPWLSIAVVFAGASEWVVTRWELAKYTKNHPTVSLISHIKGFWSYWKEPDVRAVLTGWASSAIGVGASQVNSAIDPIFARYADPEGPAYLWFAMRLEQLPFALFGIGISTVLLPPLSKAAKNKEWDQYAHYFRTAILRWNRMMIPAMYLLLLTAAQIVILIYDHGDFTELSVRQTTRCTWAYTSGILPSSLILILASSFYAISRYSVPMKLSFLAITTNIFLNSLFIWGFNLGAMSIAISTSIASWINCVIVLILIKRLLPNLYSHFNLLYYNGLIHILTGFISASAAAYLSYWLLDDPSYLIWSQADLDLTPYRAFFPAFKAALFSSGIFITSYLSLLKFPLFKKYLHPS
jgi:putative peptidoglycan lipid II flippase